jgi:hypothetical protein
MKNAVFWDVAPCRSCVNRRSSETSVYIRSTWRHVPEDGILYGVINFVILFSCSSPLSSSFHS